MTLRASFRSSLHDSWVSLYPSHNLKTRLGLAIGGIVLLLSLLVSWLVGATTSAQLQANYGESLAELAYQMSDKLDRGLFERYREIQILAALEPIRDPSFPLGAKRSLLEAVQRTYPDYAWLGLTDAKGKVQVSTQGILEGANVSHRPVFQNGRQAPTVGDVHEAVMLNKILPPLPQGEPRRFLDVSAPVRNANGELQGVIVAHLNFTWAKEVQESILEPMQQHRPVEIFVLNTQGTVLLGAPELKGKTLSLPSIRAAQANQNRYVLESWSNAEQFVTGFARSRGYREYLGLGWLVLVRQRAEVALAPVRSLQKQILGIGLGIGIAFVILGWVSASRIVDPMVKIAKAADHMQRGDRTVSIPVLHGRDELATLARSLRHLVTTLDDRQAALRQSETRYRSLAEERAELLAREQAAREQAENANRLKDQFLMMLSHELRTPLNPILGWTKILLSRSLDSATHNALLTIERNVQLQTQLVGDLLDLSSILSGKMSVEMQPVELIPILDAALETVRLAAEAKQIRISKQFDPTVGTVLGDAARLQQIVWNLAANAVKFTPIGGDITVLLTAERAPSDQKRLSHPLAVIKVCDTGKGISPEFLPHVFDTFRQEDGSITRKFGGLGLGLSIVRSLTEAHGGTIQAESKGEGLGAAFTVRLPVLQAKSGLTPSAAPANAYAKRLSNLKILVVDDEPDMCELSAAILEHYPVTVKTAASAMAALQLLDDWQPDVLISDIGMPDVDGYMLMQMVRARFAAVEQNHSVSAPRPVPTANCSAVPIAIALTAYASEYDRNHALSVGFQRHLSKPVTPDDLVAAISDLTEQNERCV